MDIIKLHNGLYPIYCVSVMIQKDNAKCSQISYLLYFIPSLPSSILFRSTPQRCLVCPAEFSEKYVSCEGKEIDRAVLRCCSNSLQLVEENGLEGKVDVLERQSTELSLADINDEKVCWPCGGHCVRYIQNVSVVAIIECANHDPCTDVCGSSVRISQDSYVPMWAVHVLYIRMYICQSVYKIFIYQHYIILCVLHCTFS